MEHLSNGIIEISVSSHGAELQSIRKNGIEYLWHGDPTYWGRRAPVLFPIVGSVWEKRLRVKGHTYQMGQHGFARDMEFTLAGHTDNSLTYRLESDRNTLERYPYHFCLDVTYLLEGSEVKVIWEVKNTWNEEMFFQIGAHPAFNFPDFKPEAGTKGWFSLSKQGIRANAIDYLLIQDKGCVSLEKHHLDLQDGLLPLGLHTFDQDALILEDSQADTVTLHDATGRPWLCVHFDAPLVGLWSPAGKNAPFVCIEPWYGRCDRYGYTGEFKDKDHINRLAPEESFHSSYSICLL